MKQLITALLGFSFFYCISQEGLTPLRSNLNYAYLDFTKSTKEEPGVSVLKTNSITIQIPFKDDFYYSTLSKYPRMHLWMDSSVYVNSGYPIAPPSIGVATFDGLNQYGYPYTPNDLTMTNSNPADTLRSRPINLYQSGSQILQISDSIALSFYYQARGNGEPPEVGDSLILDFYQPQQHKWLNRVWFVKGNTNPNTNDTVFKRAFIWLDSTVFLKDSFQFRFRNRATTSGNFDHWHIDYVYLNKNRSMRSDTVYNDLTFGNVPSSFLDKYSAMPYEQYNPSEMAMRNSVRIKNNGASPINMSYENRFYDKTNALVHSYNGGADGSLDPFKPFGYSQYINHSNPPFAFIPGSPSSNYVFPIMTDSADFTIKHYLYRAAGPGSTSDFIYENDTIYQKQIFRNYFAYDDGSSEGGYYVNGVMGKMAIKFSLNYTDTLRAVRIYFDPAGAIANTQQVAKFRIYLWSNGTSGPGSALYYDSIMLPNYYDSIIFKPSPTYSLTTKWVLGPGTYYIGFQQAIASGIVVGFDKNQDRHQNLFYDSGSGWAQSQIKGALMLNPVFGKFVPPPVSVSELKEQKKVLRIFPNPTDDILYLQQEDTKSLSCEIYNGLGQLVLIKKMEEQQSTFSTRDLENGVYFILVKEGQTALQRMKLIIHH